MTSKPTGSGASASETPAPDAAAVSPLGAVQLEPRDGMDATDRQNLMDTHATASRRPGDPDASVGSIGSIVSMGAAPSGGARAVSVTETPPTVEDTKPGADEPDEADVQAPDGWFRTQPPNEPRGDEPGQAKAPVDPVMYVLVAVAVGVVVVVGGFLLYGG